MALAPNTAALAANNESGSSAVSWAAIIGGAVVASALSLILLSLGTGVGLASISPYANSGASGTTLGTSAIIWLIIVQIVSAGMGGYLAGRLRTRWTSVHSDEIYFRDTAHGFMTWALGAIVSATLLASAASSVIGTGAQATGSIVSGLASAVGSVGGAASTQAANNSGIQSYFTDMLFRSDKAATDPNNQATVAEVGRIMSRSLASGEIAPADKTYVGQLIAAKTGLSQADAEKRVDDTIAQAKAAAAKAEQTARDAADAARKAAAYLSLWLFISMLIGAFSSTIAATFGGRARDAAALTR
ncbi:hypothetical protein [Lichenihabitans psoromatis]|uniref:hypothetical protein n=1 Tax=Lichenihabitans psoromatis TaxID=2528642 RepID=UPI0010363A14|nr:hypothetical protein [Lichenihabitans psoromatis]